MQFELQRDKPREADDTFDEMEILFKLSILHRFQGYSVSRSFKVTLSRSWERGNAI